MKLARGTASPKRLRNRSCLCRSCCLCCLLWLFHKFCRLWCPEVFLWSPCYLVYCFCCFFDSRSVFGSCTDFVVHCSIVVFYFSVLWIRFLLLCGLTGSSVRFSHSTTFHSLPPSIVGVVSVLSSVSLRSVLLTVTYHWFFGFFLRLLVLPSFTGFVPLRSSSVSSFGLGVHSPLTTSRFGASALGCLVVLLPLPQGIFVEDTGNAPFLLLL